MLFFNHSSAGSVRGVHLSWPNKTVKHFSIVQNFSYFFLSWFDLLIEDLLLLEWTSWFLFIQKWIKLYDL